MIGVGLGVLTLAMFGVAWGQSRWGVVLLQRHFTTYLFPQMEMLGREEELDNWFRYTVLASLLALGVGVFVKGILFGLLIAAAITVAPFFYVQRLGTQRVEKIDNLLPGALDALASALRSGQSMQQAMVWVAKESPAPMGEEFGRLSRELALGRSLEESLNAMSQRVPSAGVRTLTMTVGPLRAMGANMIPAFEGMADILRRRASTAEKLASLTSQAKMQLWVMGMMAPGMLAFLFAMEPVMTGRLFFTTTGQVFLFIVALLQVVGLVLAQRILDPERIWD